MKRYCIFLAGAVLISGPSLVTAASTASSPMTPGCATAVSAFAASLPAAARTVFPGRDPDAWPSFDATTAAMVPDAVLGEPVVHTFVDGGDPTTRWDPDAILDDAPPTLAERVGRDVTDQVGVEADDARMFTSLFDEPTYHLEISASRIPGVTGAELLPAIVERRLARFADATCDSELIAGLPVLTAASGIDHFAFLGFRDAWLVADTTDNTPGGLMGDQPGPWDPARFHQAVADMATVIAGLPADLPEPPATAPKVGTRITPPRASEDLAGILDAIAPRDKLTFFGDASSMLGRGMVPGSMLGVFAPQIPEVAAELGVDHRMLWGDQVVGFDIDDDEATIQFFAFVDPTGHGERWIDPLAASYRGPSIMGNGIDYGFDGEGEAPTLPPVEMHRMTVGGKHVQGVMKDDFGSPTITAFYASGPYVFMIHSGSKQRAAEILRTLP